MSLKNAIATCFQKYATFSGRARRSEYWYFVLFVAIVNAIVGRCFASVPLLPSLCSLALFIPNLAVSCRRMHDIGRSGWWLLISFIPLVGWIIMLIFNFSDSEDGTNAYGPNPKEKTCTEY